MACRLSSNLHSFRVRSVDFPVVDVPSDGIENTAIVVLTINGCLTAQKVKQGLYPSFKWSRNNRYTKEEVVRTTRNGRRRDVPRLGVNLHFRN
jgi:hypothetical protein